VIKAKRLWILTVVCLVAVAAQAAETPSEKPGPVRLALPEMLYAVPGVEANVYFDNVVLVLNPANYAFDVSCAKGAQQVERWTFTPKPEDVGDFPFVLEVRDGTNAIIARGQSTLHVVAADAGAVKPVSTLLIGDSLTHASVYSQQLLDRCGQDGNPTLTLIGTHCPSDESGKNRHEGYGGWTAARFATHYTGAARTANYKERGSPFIYEDPDGAKKLDFARYCEETNGGKAPDCVTIFLGCNDTFSANDESIESTIDGMLGHMDTLVAMVRGLSAETKIGLIVPVPPAGTQDAFAANYRSGQTRWQYKRNQHRVVERMLEQYGPREAEGITIIPAYVSLDCLHNYAASTGPWNAHTAATGPRLNNGVHPSAEGYRQIGDSVYAWLKALL
jgi:lysophospholipase L1-like esterase